MTPPKATEPELRRGAASDITAYGSAQPSSDTGEEKKPSPVSVRPLKLASFDDDEDEKPAKDKDAGIGDMLMGVPLEVSAEIGRVRKEVRELLNVRPGTIIDLDRQAGDPVDVIVNGQMIAKGDVVIVEDNFGVRITEILTGPEIVRQLR